jgi:hypothetical protein
MATEPMDAFGCARMRQASDAAICPGVTSAGFFSSQAQGGATWLSR